MCVRGRRGRCPRARARAWPRVTAASPTARLAPLPAALVAALAPQDGVSDRVMQASVFVVFDNADGRLPVDGGEVAVGRVLGVKKDEYFLQGKLVKKADIAALLDAAGFSRSNPYYIVAQGEVQKVGRAARGRPRRWLRPAPR